MPDLLILGFGYSGRAVASTVPGDWRITATVRSAARAAQLTERRIAGIAFDGTAPVPALAAALADATHLLVTAAPDPDDPLLTRHRADLLAAPKLSWIGYLSTVGVYGDHGGGRVDETTPVKPGSERARRRVAAEEAWLALGAERGTPVQLFRLGGIYGPGRNQIASLLDGTQRRIAKPGQVFSRIHVEDIAGLVCAGMARPHAGPVFNGVDDEPAPPQEVVVYAASLLGIAPPPEVPWTEAGLSPMGLSFYAENKRVSNALTKAALGYRFKYPTYREGLAALAATRGISSAIGSG